MEAVLDDFVDVLGDFESQQAILASQRPKIDIIADGKVVETAHKTLPDHILLQGKLKSGAVASISVSRGNQVIIVFGD